MQCFDSFNRDHWSTGSGDACTHHVEQAGQVLHLRFLGCVFDCAGAFGKHRSHQNRLCRSHAGAVQDNLSASEPFSGSRQGSGDDAMFDTHNGSKGFEAPYVFNNGPCADATAPWERNLGLSKPSKQWTDAEETRSQTVDQFIGRV